MSTIGSWWAVGLASASGNTLVWGSLGLSIVLVAARWICMQKPSGGMRAPMGEVNWNFSNSWASSLTAAGAVLGTILSANLVPASAVPFSAGALAGLNLLFGFIVVLAPLVFSTSFRIKRPAPGDTAPDYAGYIGLFLVAVVLTVWATVGELATITILLNELQSGTLSSALAWLFFALLLISIASTCLYAWGTIKTTIDYAGPQTPDAPRPQGRAEEPAQEPDVPTRTFTPRPWNLL
jgi:hypothetical protein